MVEICNHHPRQILAKGWTSIVYAGGDIDFDKVIKVIDPDGTQREGWTVAPDLHGRLFQVERAVYERMAQQPDCPNSLLRYYGLDPHSERGLILERAGNGGFCRYVRGLYSVNRGPDAGLLYRWALQAGQALTFIHHHAILHNDIHMSNLFLDDEMNLRLADFGAASIDGSSPLLWHRTTHQLWLPPDGNQPWRKALSPASELFALGSALYNIETRHDPLRRHGSDEDDDTIRRRVRERDMPDTSTLALGPIIRKCWSLAYRNAQELCDDAQRLIDQSGHGKEGER